MTWKFLSWKVLIVRRHWSTNHVNSCICWEFGGSQIRGKFLFGYLHLITWKINKLEFNTEILSFGYYILLNQIHVLLISILWTPGLVVGRNWQLDWSADKHVAITFTSVFCFSVSRVTIARVETSIFLFS